MAAQANVWLMQLTPEICDNIVDLLFKKDTKNLIKALGRTPSNSPNLEAIRGEKLTVPLPSSTGDRKMLELIMAVRKADKLPYYIRELVVSDWSTNSTVEWKRKNGEALLGPRIRKQMYDLFSDAESLRKSLDARTVAEVQFPVLLYHLPYLRLLRLNTTPRDIERMLFGVQQIRDDIEKELDKDCFCPNLIGVEVNVNPPAAKPKRRQPDAIRLIAALIGGESVRKVKISGWFDDKFVMSTASPEFGHISWLALHNMKISPDVATAFLRNFTGLKILVFEEPHMNPMSDGRKKYAMASECVAAVASGNPDALQELYIEASSVGGLIHGTLQDRKLWTLAWFRNLQELMIDPRFLVAPINPNPFALEPYPVRLPTSLRAIKIDYCTLNAADILDHHLVLEYCQDLFTSNQNLELFGVPRALLSNALLPIRGQTSDRACGVGLNRTCSQRGIQLQIS